MNSMIIVDYSGLIFIRTVILYLCIIFYLVTQYLKYSSMRFLSNIIDITE